MICAKTLKDGGKITGREDGLIRVQSNMSGLFRGAQTGGMNTDLVHRQGADGNLIDHSEARERLEGSVKDMIIAMFTARQAILDKLKMDMINVPKAYNLKEKEIERNPALLPNEKELLLKQTKQEFQAHMAELQPAAEKALAQLENEYFISTKEGMSRLERTSGLDAKNQEIVRRWVADYYERIKNIDEESLADIVSRIVNLVKNQQLKADIAFSRDYFKKFGVYPYKVTTLCLGEKKSQYDPNDPSKAWKILGRDLKQMLDGISTEDAAIIGLRLAYEPRWVIGADSIPEDVRARINDTHGFSKNIKGVHRDCACCGLRSSSQGNDNREYPRTEERGWRIDRQRCE